MKKSGWSILLAAVLTAGFCFGDVGVAGIHAESWLQLLFGASVCFGILSFGMAFVLLGVIGIAGKLFDLAGAISTGVKKLRARMSLLLLFGLLAGAFFIQPAQAAPPVAMEVGTNAVKILPERNLTRSYGTVWSATNAVSQGDIIRWSNQHYMAQTAGTLGTNAPDTKVYTPQTNGTVVLRYVEGGPRLGFILMLNDAGPIRVNVNGEAIPNIGIKLEGDKSLWQESGRGAPQGAIWAVSDSGTNTVSALDW